MFTWWAISATIKWGYTLYSVMTISISGNQNWWDKLHSTLIAASAAIKINETDYTLRRWRAVSAAIKWDKSHYKACGTVCTSMNGLVTGAFFFFRSIEIFFLFFFSNSLRLLPARPTGICSITWQGLVRRFCEWLTAVLLPSRPSLAFHVVPRHDLAHLERHRNHSLLIHGYCRLAAATACGRTKHRAIPRSGLTEERYLFPWKHGPSGCWRWRESGCLVGVSSPCWDLSVGICADSRESALS